MPWIAGLYALACQVKPDITPEQFWAEALMTGETIRLQRGGAEIQFGSIANPVALVERLQKDETHPRPAPAPAARQFVRSGQARVND